MKKAGHLELLALLSTALGISCKKAEQRKQLRSLADIEPLLLLDQPIKSSLKKLVLQRFMR